jgi:hypothetical protein
MVEAFLEAVRSNEDLQRQLRGVTTAAGLAEVAAQAGLNEVGAFYWTDLTPDIVNSGREEQGSISV